MVPGSQAIKFTYCRCSWIVRSAFKCAVREVDPEGKAGNADTIDPELKTPWQSWWQLQEHGQLGKVACIVTKAHSGIPAPVLHRKGAERDDRSWALSFPCTFL